MTMHRGYVNCDFDDYITAGTWAYGGGAMHDPGVGWGMLRVSPGYYITQEFFSEKTFSTRTKTEKNVWTDWKTYVTYVELAPKTIVLPSLIADSQDSKFNYLHVSGSAVELNVDIVTSGVTGEVDVVQIPDEYIPTRNIYTQCRIATSGGVNTSAYCLIYTGSGRLRVILPTTNDVRNISAHFCWIK